MILHHYTPGDQNIVNYYGHGFGSIFARLFSKVAAKTASRAALGVAKRVGSKLVKTGVKKVIPIAKRTLTSVVKKGVKKAVPVAKKMIKKGVKRAAEEAQTAIANKVRKVEESAIKKGVSPELAHMVSIVVENGSREGIKGLSSLANKKGDKVVARVVKEVNKSTLPQRQVLSSKKGIPKARRLKSHRQRVKSSIGKKRRRQKVSYQIQNLIDSA